MLDGEEVTLPTVVREIRGVVSKTVTIRNMVWMAADQTGLGGSNVHSPRGSVLIGSEAYWQTGIAARLRGRCTAQVRCSGMDVGSA